MSLHFTGLSTAIARAYQNGEPDAYGKSPETKISDGGAIPCRHCLRHVAKGAPYLVLAHRPFETLQPYAETGPIFLCADPCDPHEGTVTPDIFQTSPDYLIKGYTKDQRISYGTGAVVTADTLRSEISAILSTSDIAFVDIRSSRNNCWQARVTRSA